MRIRHFATELWLPASQAEVFDFFADAQNLDTITPPWLRFEMVTPVPEKMRAGLLIDYRLRLHGLGVRWRTRIAEWQPPHRFVDEQVHGPYRLWVHTHEFETRDGGTMVRDRVRYAVPFDFIAYRLLVRRDMKRIFGYRERRLREIFPTR